MRKVATNSSTVNQYSLNEITAVNDVTNRTAGTADTIQKTFDSTNNNSRNAYEKIPHHNAGNPEQ